MHYFVNYLSTLELGFGIEILRQPCQFLLYYTEFFSKPNFRPYS